MGKKHILTASITSLLAASGYTPASAQSIDYASLESMFGEPVTTSATGKPQRASDITLSMTILTAENIRRTGATSIAEALQNVPEINSVQTSRTNYDINVRGYNQVLAPNLLVLVNGRQVYLDNYGMTVWETIPVQLDEIRQIEIIKGPNTALFGFNATSGVINIITYNPLFDNVSLAKYTRGTGNFSQADIVQSFKVNDKIGMRVSGSRKTTKDYTHNLEPLDKLNGFTHPYRNAINIDTVAQVSDHSQLRTEAALSNINQNELLTTYTLYPTPVNSRSIRSEYQLDSDFGLIKANIYKNWIYVGNINFVDITMKNDVTVAQLEDTFRVGNAHTFRGMLEHRVNTLTGSVIGTGAKVWYDVNSASGMWDWQISDTVSMNNAVRVDGFSLHREGAFITGNPLTNNDYEQIHTYPSYNSGIAWKVTPHDTLRASTARGVETPSLYELGTNFMLIGRLPVIGNPRLDPTILTHYETAWDHQFETPQLKTSLTYFHQNWDDLKLASIGTSSIGTSGSDGITAVLEGKWGNHLTWDTSYTYQIIDDNITSPRRNFAASTPRHSARAHIGYAINDWELDGYASYISPTENYDGTTLFFYALRPVDSYITTSARIGYNINDATTIALMGQNLEASHSSKGVGLDAERAVFLSLTRKF